MGARLTWNVYPITRKEGLNLRTLKEKYITFFENFHNGEEFLATGQPKGLEIRKDKALPTSSFCQLMLYSNSLNKRKPSSNQTTSYHTFAMATQANVSPPKKTRHLSGFRLLPLELFLLLYFQVLAPKFWWTRPQGPPLGSQGTVHTVPKNNIQIPKMVFFAKCISFQIKLFWGIYASHRQGKHE